jgi:LPS-assembly protein
MDYIVHIERRALKHSLTPYVQSGGGKGTGAGLSGAFAWDTGSVSLGVAYGSKVGFEWMAGIDQSLGGGFSLEAGIEYSWDRAWEDKEYRPRVGLLYESGGWEVALRATWSEYIEDRKDPYYEYLGRLDRKPELTVFTPWIKDPTLDLSWFRIGVTAGAYWERTPHMTGETVTRYGATFQSYFEYPLGRSVTFFSNSTYGAWFYDKDDADQEIADGIMGLRYNLGVFELASGYEHRKVWGESPMLWDSYRDVERIHQKIRFPLGNELFLTVRGSYDLDS